MAIHLDYETSSYSDIKKVGHYRYANDPTTRILMFGIARDDGPVKMWRFDKPDSEESVEALELFQESIEYGELIYAHNAPFELAITRYRIEKDLDLPGRPKLESYRCVQAMCQRAALPVSLKLASKVLKVSEKDESGDQLIAIFSDQNKIIALQAPDDLKLYDKSTKGRKHPNRKSRSPIHGWDEGDTQDFKDGTDTHHNEVLWDWKVKLWGEWITVREAWRQFIEYCRQDVITEREIHAKLHKFELKGDVLDSFLFNLRMNDRGVPVNRVALKNAQRLILQYERINHTRFRNITGLNPTQGQKFKPWLQERGYFRDDLQADTVSDFMEEYDDLLDPDAHAALSLYRLLNFAALAKIPAMLNSMCDDGYVRGTMLWHGARTGRATGKIIQPQNMRKATVATELAYQMICDGCTLEEFEEMWDNPLEVIASCARHFIQPHEGKAYDADYVGVEARLAPWAVGDTNKLNSILRGEDQYRVVASAIYDKPYEDIRKPSKERDVGKRAELACQFGTGGPGLKDALKKLEGLSVPLKEAKRVVAVYRKKYHKTVAAWKEIEDAAKLAIREGTTSTVLGGTLTFGIVKTAGLRYLVMRLPCGRRIYYPSAKVDREWKKYTPEEMAEDSWKAEKQGYWLDQIKFWGSKPNNAGWGWIATWGSRLFENAIQAMGADLLDQGCLSAEKAGFIIFLIVHDQALSYQHRTKTLKQYEDALCDVGEWADSFPLEADGEVVPYYRKEID